MIRKETASLAPWLLASSRDLQPCQRLSAKIFLHQNNCTHNLQFPVFLVPEPRGWYSAAAPPTKYIYFIYLYFSSRSKYSTYLRIVVDFIGCFGIGHIYSIFCTRVAKYCSRWVRKMYQSWEQQTISNHQRLKSAQFHQLWSEFQSGWIPQDLY